MKIFSFCYLAAILLATTICSSQAATVFSENFGSLANGTTITTANTGLNYARIGTSSTGTGVGNFLYATNDQFSGASALMGALGGSLTGIGETNLTAFAVGTLNFSIYSSSTLSTLAIFLGTGSTTFVGNSTFTGTDLTAGFQFVAGQLQTRNSANAWANVGAAGFAGNTIYNFSIVFNDSVSTVTYGSDSVAAGTADIWVNGTLFGDDVSIRGAQTTTAFRFYTTSSTAPIEIDNIVLSDTAVAPVPEPSTLALATLGGVACLFALRRKR